MTRAGTVLIGAGLVLLGCQTPPAEVAKAAPEVPAMSADELAAEVEEWRQKRYSSLRKPDGWLALAGLYWLEEGENRFGSAPGNELVFPLETPVVMGKFVREGDKVTVIPLRGVDIRHDGQRVRELELVSDAQGEPTVLDYKTYSFYVIERGDRVGVRLKNSSSKLLASFDGIDHFPTDTEWRVAARWEPHPTPRKVMIPNIIGDDLEATAPGVAVFEVEGREYRLEPTGDPDKRLFFVFGDETNGIETYGAGRFLYADGPDENGALVLDFNKAYNPPCVFTPYATCPLPRPEDKLALRVEAGEKSFDGGYGAGH